jgi:hydroxyacylglutathione hydrolase
MTNNNSFRHRIQSVIPIKLGVVNSFIIQGEKSVIVDTGYPGNGNRILRHLSANAVNIADISLIIITHAHTDHYGSAAELRILTRAPVAVHKADTNDIRQGLYRIGSPAGLSGQIIKRLFIRTEVVTSQPLEPNIILEDDTNLQEFGVEGSIISTPGHTPGSVSVVLDGGDAIVGDLLMGGLVFRRTPHLPMFVSDMVELKKSIARLAQLSPGIVFASHGGPFSRSDIEEFAQKNAIR